MNPVIKIRSLVNRKAVAILAFRFALGAFAGYGLVAGYNNLSAYSVRQYHAFVASQAAHMGIVATQVEVHYVVDPVQASTAIAQAAQDGAKAGADASIKANLSK